MQMKPEKTQSILFLYPSCMPGAMAMAMDDGD
jgi:hypothetical protein